MEFTKVELRYLKRFESERNRKQLVNWFNQFAPFFFWGMAIIILVVRRFVDGQWNYDSLWMFAFNVAFGSHFYFQYITAGIIIKLQYRIAELERKK